MSEFLKGTSYVFEGIRFFYRTPALWKYSLIPFLFLLIFYLILFYAVYRFAVPYILDFLPEPQDCAVWLRWLIYPLRWLTAFSCYAATLLISLLTLSTGYELAGALFFDAMVVRIERIRYQRTVCSLPFRKNLEDAFHSALFSAGTLVIALLFLPLSVLLPGAGVLLMALFIGYRQALSCLFASGFNRGLTLREIRRRAGTRKMLVLGFGVSVYLLFLIPFAAVFLIPGFAVSGTLLYNGEFAK